MLAIKVLQAPNASRREESYMKRGKIDMGVVHADSVGNVATV